MSLCRIRFGSHSLRMSWKRKRTTRRKVMQNATFTAVVGSSTDDDPIELLQQYPDEDWIYPSPEEAARMEQGETERKVKQEENDDEDTLLLLELPYPIESQDWPKTEPDETEENGDGGTEEGGDGSTEGHDLL